MSIDLFHDLMVIPAAAIHGDLCGDTEVGGEGGKAVPELVDSDALDTGLGTGACDSLAKGGLSYAKKFTIRLPVALDRSAKLWNQKRDHTVRFLIFLILFNDIFIFLVAHTCARRVKHIGIGIDVFPAERVNL